MKSVSHFLLQLFIAIIAFSSAQAQDKTLSPYFYVSSGSSETEAFPLLHTEAQVNIAGVIADVQVTQMYKNEGKNPIEAIYLFPASTNAAVYAMRMKIGKRTIEAKIEERQKARHDYEQAKREGKSASLLEQQRPNVFQMNVANIMPGDTVKVVLQYTEHLIPEDGTYQFTYPTVVGPRYAGETPDNQISSTDWVENPYLHEGKKPPYTFDLNLCLQAGLPVQQVNCPSHKVKVDFLSKEEVVVGLDPAETAGGNKDFVLDYQLKGKEIENGLLLYEGEKENFFLMMMQPPEQVPQQSIPPREYIFIVDVSGSMSGFPLNISKDLLRNLIGQLRPTDRFNVLLFAGRAGFLSETSVAATPANIQKAVQTIDHQRGSGGTHLLNALQTAMSHPKSEGFSRSFVIATDGYVSVEAEAFDFIRDNLGKANFFAFGIGSSVNRHLIEGMARMGHSTPFVVLDAGEATGAAKKFQRYIQTPALTNIKVEFKGFDAYDITPKQVPDLMGERPVLVYGKYKKGSKGQIVISGHNGNGRFSKSIPLKEAKAAEENQALQYLWARHRIKVLGDYVDLRGADREANVKEITELGLQYNLLTKFTSFIAIDSEVRNEDGKSTTVKQPLPLPEGVSDQAIGQTLGMALTSSHVRRTKKRDRSTVYEEKLELSDLEAVDQERDPGSPPPPPPPPAKPAEKEVFIVVEEMPRFPGCEKERTKEEKKKCSDKALQTFIADNIQYPRLLNHGTIEGKVIVQFVVSEDGRITDVKIIRSPHELLSKEVIRLISLMPEWIPGRQKGKAVKVWYTLPVSFKFN